MAKAIPVATRLSPTCILWTSFLHARTEWSDGARIPTGRRPQPICSLQSGEAGLRWRRSEHWCSLSLESLNISLHRHSSPSDSFLWVLKILPTRFIVARPHSTFHHRSYLFIITIIDMACEIRSLPYSKLRSTIPVPSPLPQNILLLHHPQATMLFLPATPKDPGGPTMSSAQTAPHLNKPAPSSLIPCQHSDLPLVSSSSSLEQLPSPYPSNPLFSCFLFGFLALPLSAHVRRVWSFSPTSFSKVLRSSFGLLLYLCG